MLSFFEALMEYVGMAWQFLLNIITTTLSLVSALASAIIVPDMIMSHVGGIISASAVAVCGFAVIKILLGRSSI